MDYPILRRAFWWLNKFFMVPMFRLGLGIFMGNPITSYIMVVKTTGRKTGKTRYTPVNYHIRDGCVYCTAGFGRVSHWYHNLRANPRVELILPGRAISGVAEEVTAPEEAFSVLRQLLKETGLVGFFGGFNPFTVSEDEFRQKTEGLPVIRIRPTGLAAGPYDAGGWFWLLLAALTLAVILAVVLG